VSSVDLVREFYEACLSVDPDLKAIIQLAVLDEQLNTVYLGRQDCNSRLQLGLRAEIGRRVPANCTAAGKALLAALPPEELEERLSGLKTLPTLTRSSIGTPAKLRRELQAIRARGHSTDDEEVLPGIACVAKAAETKHREDGLIAISITAAKDGLDPARQEMLREVLSALIDDVSQRL
jgi:DNA-binding IclR family transcriptional regulator